MQTIEIIGLIAASLTTGAFVPQVVKAYREKSTKDISLTMYIILFVGVLLWLIYGIHHKSFAIILANAITGILVLLMIILKLKIK